jgi:uncharacterized membrane protein
VEISRSVVTMSTTGQLVLAAGLATCRRQLARGPLHERAIALGRVFVAAPLATFGGLHLAAAQGISQMVPVYMPWRRFWAYLVGVALIATGLSLISGRLVRWSSLLCGAMMLAFVLMLHVPETMANPHSRFVWAVLLRDTGFGAGLLALAGSTGSPGSGWRHLVTASRIEFSITALFFSVEHFLHPEFLPGVPLARMTPAWIPAPRAWGYAMGAVLLASGALLLANRRAREAAAWLGLAVFLVVVGIEVPMLWPSHGTAEVVESINYIADTLLFAGSALLVGEASGTGKSAGIHCERSN